MDKTLKEKKKVAVNLEATIRMGKSGVTQSLIDEIKDQIKRRDAVKIKLLGTKREETKIIASELAERCNANLIDVRGNTVVLWKK
ncbi:MAG: YhbY family RNA-binding protein [Thermoplasmata archaeon]|nr:YhbY family RNA-binding protein [Thermoplasmata archaeon]